MRTRASVVVLAMALGGVWPTAAQWLNVPSKGLPRTADGKADMNAPALRMPDGKPDLRGVWMPQGRFVFDIASGMKPEEIPYQPWAKALYDSRQANESIEDPVGHCIPAGVPRADVVPYPWKLLQLPDEFVILYEAVQGFRQIFTDGRAMPKDPNPTWMGYSVGHWDGDTLVIETTGFNDKGWLDNAGRPATDALHVTERLARKNIGQLTVAITINDPKAYTKPWTVNETFRLLADTDLLEYVCNENNKDLGHLVGK